MHHEKSTITKCDSVNIFTPGQLDANLLPPANLLASVPSATHILQTQVTQILSAPSCRVSTSVCDSDMLSSTLCTVQKLTHEPVIILRM